MGIDFTTRIASLSQSGHLGIPCKTSILLISPVSLTTNFPSNSLPANMNLFPAAFWVDVDFDNKKDLIVGAKVVATSKSDPNKIYKSITKFEMETILKDNGVTLIGAGLDEAPMAYKDINQVMAAQKELVEVVAKFSPKMVRMADDGSMED